QTLEVGLEHSAHLVGAQIRETVDVMLIAGVEDENVQAAESVPCLEHRLTGEILVAQVAREAEPRPSGLSHEVEGNIGIRLLFGQVRDRDIRTLSREGYRHGPPNAGITTGDQRLAALET